MEQQVTVTGAARAAAAPITAADQARIERYVEKSRSSNTRAQYRSAWRAWVAWCAEHGHATLPADPAAVAAYLTHRADQGAAAATVRVARAAIAAAHRDAGVADPTRDHEGVARTVQGIARDAVGRGRGQAQPLTADGLAAIIATASIPRRTGRGLEADVQAQQRGTVDKAIAGLLFQGGLRRSEAAALRWADVRKAADGRGLLVQVRRSKTDQEGTAADVRYLKNGAAVVVWAIRPPSPADDAPVLGGLNGQSVARTRSHGWLARSRCAPYRRLRRGSCRGDDGSSTRSPASPQPPGPPASRGVSPGTQGASGSPPSSPPGAQARPRPCLPVAGRRRAWSPTTAPRPPPSRAPSPSTCRARVQRRPYTAPADVWYIIPFVRE